mgnify:CR=1 FL=1
MFEWITQPWPWYVAGPIIGLMLPILLLVGNKSFGISASLRHACAACAPAGIQFFKYNWRGEVWNLFFAGGILAGGFIGGVWLANPEPVQIAASTKADLNAMGISDFSGLLPPELFSFEHFWTLPTLMVTVVGGFLVGFGTRYAGGCTSGHAIAGISNLQLPSLVATIMFMLGGFFSTHVLFPLIF